MELVQGGGMDARCWDRIIPFLDEPVRALDLPGRGTRPADLASLRISDLAAAVVDDMATADLHDVVLVGHSLAGITLPLVAAAAPHRLRRLVFLACAIPPHDSTVADVLASFSPAAADIARRIGPEAITSDGLLHPELRSPCADDQIDKFWRRWLLDVAEAGLDERWRGDFGAGHKAGIFKTPQSPHCKPVLALASRDEAPQQHNEVLR